jgi:enoyl-CoA hydratase
MEGVQSIAKQIAAKSPISIRGTKVILQYTRDHSVDEALEFMARWNATHLLSDDLKESFRAVMQKRKADYKDS